MKAHQLKITSSERPVVMVDDESLDIAVAKRYYDRSRLENPFMSFADGERFVAFIEGAWAGGDPLPCLVLLDINMPRMNGHDVLRRLRSKDEFRKVPTIAMLTSSTDQNDIDEAHALGANDYFVKPYKPDAYLELFNSLLPD